MLTNLIACQHLIIHYFKNWLLQMVSRPVVNKLLTWKNVALAVTLRTSISMMRTLIDNRLIKWENVGK